MMNSVIFREYDIRGVVGKDFDEIVGTGARRTGGGEGADIDLILFGKPQEKRGGDRALVALDVIEIGRTYREARRHVGLRQPAVAAEAAKGRTKEQLRFGHQWKLSTLHKDHKSIYDNATNFDAENLTFWRCLRGETQPDSLKDRRHDQF